jgi:hypothetical protein
VATAKHAGLVVLALSAFGPGAYAQTSGQGIGQSPGGASVHGQQAMSQDQQAAEGNNNQAVATTDADASLPAKGANSFTRGEAARRIVAHGFAAPTGLTKDKDGIWRGKSQKNGMPVSVWLDYKGDIGSR